MTESQQANSAQAGQADRGVAFAVSRRVAGQDAPFLVTANRPLAGVAIDALRAADSLLAREGAGLALLQRRSAAALAHASAPVPD